MDESGDMASSAGSGASSEVEAASRWVTVDGAAAGQLEQELARQVPAGHPLHGVAARAVARRLESDDVLFALADGRRVVVHLTGAVETDPRWPAWAPAPDHGDAAPHPETREAPAADSPYVLAQRLSATGLDRAAILERLRASGLDEEQARVALNAVDGPTPTELPSATLAPGINPLAPGRFSLSDLGLSGNPAVVALYWMAFGATVMLLVAGLLALPDLGVGEATAASSFWGRVGLGLGGLAFSWGVLRLLASLHLRRRP